MKQKLAEIIVGTGRRPVEPAKVTELAESIRQIGLLNPISITKENCLVAGAHRLEAIKMLGLTEIETTVVEGDDLHLELAEVDENLIRSELDPISVGELAIRRDEILESLGQRATVGQGRPSKNGETVSPLKTTESIAKEIGIGERTLQHNKQLARELAPKLTVQCYVDPSGEKLLAGAVARTEDLYACIDRGKCRMLATGNDQIGRASFYVIDWKDVLGQPSAWCPIFNA